MRGALSNIRVLDLSRVLAGPWAAQNLADLGAEVIKVERPISGDDTRGFGPPFLKDIEGKDTAESAYFISANRNKKSICVDIKAPEGRALVRALAAKCDVLVENYKVGAMKELGLDYDELAKINPRLVYCSITGFGQQGPYADLPGYDVVIQAMGGLMSVTGERNGPPQKVGVPVADLFTGMYATVAILAAVMHRERTGEGQYIDMALLDSVVAISSTPIVSYFCSGIVPGRWGNDHAHIIPYGVFDAADGQLILAVGNDEQFRRFCAVAGREEVANDERFRTNAKRIVNRDALTSLMKRLMAERTTADWSRSLNAAGVPCGPINDMEQVFDDPHVRYRRLRHELSHSAGATASVVASPMRLSKTPVEYQRAPPMLGEHTKEVLLQVLELSESEVASLVAKNVVQQLSPS